MRQHGSPLSRKVKSLISENYVSSAKRSLFEPLKRRCRRLKMQELLIETCRAAFLNHRTIGAEITDRHEEFWTGHAVSGRELVHIGCLPSQKSETH